MSLPDDEQQSFLAEAHVATIAIEEPGHPPLAVPIWYAYEQGGDLWVLTGADSVKARMLRAAGSCTVAVDTVMPRTRYVSVSCDVVEERPGGEQEHVALAERYLPAAAVKKYLDFSSGFGPEAVFVLRPTRWRSADLTLA